MNLSVLPQKVYLNGSDCFQLILEKNRELSKEGNNQLCLCVELTSDEAFKKIQNNIANSVLIHWIANIRLHNPQIGVPFYRYFNDKKLIQVIQHGIQETQFPFTILEKELSITKNEYLGFDHYVFNDKSYLIIRFHHIMFDGKGAGMLLQHICGELVVTPETIHQFLPSQLHWKNPIKQWVNLVRVKRAIERTKHKNTSFLTIKNPQETDFLLFSHSFTEEETAHIKENAKINGARFGINLFQIAAVAKAYSTCYAKSDYVWFPVPYNGRKRGSLGPIISNHTSFIFHALQITKQTGCKEIIEQLQLQMNQQLNSKLPENYNHLMQLMRFFPTWFNYLVTTKKSKGNISSFLYSSTEIESYRNETVSEPVQDQWILPPFTFPPGLTINFYLNKNQLKFHIAYSKKVTCDEEIKRFSTEIIQLLIRR